MNKLVSAMHESTHRVPGVAPHTDSPASHADVNPHAHTRSPHSQTPRGHQHTAPRVLVGWQNWIARLVGARNAD